MGVAKDLGTGTVHDICPVTGYPRDKYGHILDPLSMRDGLPIKDWNKPGTELPNTTNPYGFLHFGVGTEDDFWCFDYRVINCGPIGKFIILDATINSETGSFIDNGGYMILPVRSEAEKKEAVNQAQLMVDSACEWLQEDTHHKQGWNQDTQYFVRAVANNLFGYMFNKITDRQLRHGGKTVEKVMEEIYA